MPIGNDIIDLDEARKHRPQYYERLKTSSFTEDEWFFDVLPPGTDGLWLLWSLKESAYKALVQGEWDGRRFFPKEFVVTALKSSANDFVAEISFQDRIVRASSTLNQQFLHTVTQPQNDFDTLIEVIECPTTEYNQQSSTVRGSAINALAKKVGLPALDLIIQKNEDQVPQFFVAGQLFEQIDLSLSHHGRYAAYAISLPN